MNILSRFRCALLLTALLMSCNMQQIVNPSRPAPAYVNPHSTCVSCHGTEEPGPALFPRDADPSSICLDCHDYSENHHPQNFSPDNPADFPFPLYEGKVRCLTCHEIHGGPTHEGTLRLLREGPYTDRRTICFKCHLRDQYTAINPHIMLGSGDNIMEVNGKPVCLLCHTTTPDPEVDRTPDVRFRADVGFLCWRCHPPMPDPFFNKHFLVTPSNSMLEIMQETEEQMIVILPLVPRGRITCSTCHNPHQEGVILHEAAAKGADAHGRLRISFMCDACHNIR